MDNISKYILSHLAKPIPYMEFLAMWRLLDMMDKDEREKLRSVLNKMIHDIDCQCLILYGIEPLNYDLYDWNNIEELYHKLCRYNEDNRLRDNSISELLRQVKAGGDDGYDCVMELCDRFSYQSFDDRKRIIKSLLRDAPDCICDNIMDDMWGEILIDDIVRMWRKEKNMRYNRYIIQFASEDFVLAHITELSEHSYDYPLLCRRLGNHPDFKIDKKKFYSKWRYYSTLKYLGHKIDGEQMLEELFRSIKFYITQPKKTFWLIEESQEVHSVKNYISTKIIPEVNEATIEFNEMGLRDEILFVYEWDDTIHQLVNEKLEERYADTEQQPTDYDMWLLYCNVARHNFPDKFAHMVAIDPRRVERRNEMLGELKPYIEQFGLELEIEENADDLDFYDDTPRFNSWIYPRSIDDTPF